MLAWVILKITLSGYFLDIVENIPARSRSAQLVPVSDQGSVRAPSSLSCLFYGVLLANRCRNGKAGVRMGKQYVDTDDNAIWLSCLVDKVFDKTKSLWHLDQRSEEYVDTYMEHSRWRKFTFRWL